MGTPLGEAFVPIRATLDKLDGDLANARGKVEGVMSKMAAIVTNPMGALQNLGKVALTGLGAIVGAAAAAGAGLMALAANAEPLVGLQNAFAAITARIGSGAEAMLSALQKASGGLITNRDLMTSFNTAAALVGDDFAKRLPDAMSLVQRAAAATGQDMGFLFDSLVKGVGRVSPMILDNLGIQISLAEVTERAAQMFGKSAEELSKQEQQAALTEIVMEKLNKAYGDVPDVSKTFARLPVILANLRDEIGMKLLPVMAPLFGKLMDIGEQALPVLMDILDKKIIPVLVKVSGAFSGFLDGLMSGEDIFGDVINLIYYLGQAFGLSDEQMAGLTPTVRAIEEALGGLIGWLQTILAPIGEFIAQNVKMQDVLIALGIAIAAVVIPIIASLAASMLPIIATAALLVGAVALARKAWESNWGGIQEKTAAVIAVVQPIFEQLVAWLGENIPKAIQTLTDFWTNTLQPAMQAVWDFLTVDMMPIWEALGELLGVTVAKAIEVLTGLWQNVLQPALAKIWDWLQTKVIPAFTNWFKSLTPIATIIQTIAGKIEALAEKLKNLKLPDFLTPGSPTPFEIGLAGINDQLKELAKVSSMALTFEPGLLPAMSGAGMGVTFPGNPPASRGGGAQVIIYGGVTIRANDPEDLFAQLNRLTT